MNKYFFATVSFFLIGAFSAYAQGEPQTDSEGLENYLHFDSQYETDGALMIDPATNQGTLKLCLNNVTDDFNSFMMDVYLPEGFVIPKDEYGYFVDVNAGRGNKTYNHTINVGDNGEFYRFLGTSTTANVIQTGDDWLFSFTIQAPEGFCDGDTEYKVPIKAIEFASQSNTVSPHYFPDMEFKISAKGISSGVNELPLEGIYPEVIYDLHGYKISNDKLLAPGLYIINGRKVMITK